MNTLKLGTRGSKLALWQSQWVQKQLQDSGHAVELVIIKTTGDAHTAPLVDIGGQGVFTKRLQTALLNNEIDLAVHSLKDLPTDHVPGLALAAVPCREDIRDAWLCNSGQSIDRLPAGSVIGTGSVRRAAQLLRIRSDCQIRDIRGNVDTRIQKLKEGSYDAIVLACAGLNRLGLTDEVCSVFDVDQLMPAVGQGALGIETRDNDSRTIDAVTSLTHAATFASVIAEREMLRNLRGGCLAPIGAHSEFQHDMLQLTGVVLSPDGQHRILSCERSSTANALELGKRVAEALREQGASRFLESQS